MFNCAFVVLGCGYNFGCGVERFWKSDLLKRKEKNDLNQVSLLVCLAVKVPITFIQFMCLLREDVKKCQEQAEK